MKPMIASWFRFIDLSFATLGSKLRKLWARLRYPGLHIGPGVVFGRGVMIGVLNGAFMRIGEGTVIEPYCLLRSGGLLEIGRNGLIGRNSVISVVDRITIGDDALFAANITVLDHDHATDTSPYRSAGLVSAPVAIGCNVWIGHGVAVLKGVTVGDDAVLGAGAVVNSDVPAGARGGRSGAAHPRAACAIGFWLLEWPPALSCGAAPCFPIPARFTLAL